MMNRVINASVVVIALLMSIGLPLIQPVKAHALTGSSFQAGDIISDSVFTNYNAMSANDIQTFLSEEVPSCDTNGTQLTTHSNGSGGYYTRAQYGAVYDSANNTTEAAAPYVCLKSYIENPSTGVNNLQNPTATISGGESAAQIIYNAAQQYSINPEVLLTTMQKEQGLVTDSWPWTSEYTEAMGYNCPDTTSGAACSGYAGLYQQVNAAAKQYRNYLNNPNNYNYGVGNNAILYHYPQCMNSAGSSISCSSVNTSNGDVNCGTGLVDIQDQATAALYDYTPYQPNSAVLGGTNPTGSASGPGGTEGLCGAYGNRNFWWYFNTWFGSSNGDLVKVSGDSTVYLLSGTTAYPIYNVNVLNDFAALGPVRTTTLGEINAYTGGPPLGNMVGSSGGTLYLVNANIKLQFGSCSTVAEYGYTCTASQIPYLTDGQLNKLVTGPSVTPLLKSVDSPTVYYVEGDTKRPILNWSDVQSFQIPVMNTLTDAFVNAIPTSSYAAYGPGDLVKTPNSAQVYIVKDIDDLLSVSSFGYPQDYGLSTNVSTIASSYSVSGSLTSTIQCNGTDYLATNGTLYTVNSSMMTDYGFTSSQFKDGSTLCQDLPISTQALTQYILLSSGTVYYVTNAQKQAFTSYSAYQAHGGTTANTVPVSSFFASTLTNGSSITQ